MCVYRFISYLNIHVEMETNTLSRFSFYFILKGAMLSVIVLCTKKKKPHKVKVNIATVAPEFNVTMAKTKVSKKRGKELCTVSIFKKNTRTKMFLLNQILFFSFSVKYHKINSIK